MTLNFVRVSKMILKFVTYFMCLPCPESNFNKIRHFLSTGKVIWFIYLSNTLTRAKGLPQFILVFTILYFLLLFLLK